MQPLQDREDPFYLVDLGRLVELHQLWSAALPGVHPFYAVKCNNDPVLLQTLAALGCGFDCASKVTHVSLSLSLSLSSLSSRQNRPKVGFFGGVGHRVPLPYSTVVKVEGEEDVLCGFKS